MSREFGSYSTGYFHDQIRAAADDCLRGRGALTRLWGQFLNDFSSVAYAISSSEACDSGPDDPIMENIQKIKALKSDLFRIEAYLDTFRRVAEESIRIAMKKQQSPDTTINQKDK